MNHMLYLIGQPGSGKSTLAAALTDGLPAAAVRFPFAHTVWASTPIVVEFGARREKFSGTDALSMSVQPKVVEWLEEAPYSLVLAEGDRLANKKFFTSVLKSGWSLNIAYVAVSESVGEARRQARCAELGVAAQDPSWLKGRMSKVSRLAIDFQALILDLDGDQPADRVRDQLVASGDPVAVALASGVLV